MRDVQQAARRLARADMEELREIARHDPDMIRTVAKAAIRPIWNPCSDDCASIDSGGGPCSCGAVRAAELEAQEARA